MNTDPNRTEGFKRIEDKLDLVLARLDEVERRQRAVDELIEVAVPMMKVGLDGLSETMGDLERAGYFAFGRELMRVADRVVRSYSPSDVQRLGDSVVGILDTVRNLTQPDVLALANEVAGAVHGADEADPKGMWGLMRASRDAEVRKGFGVMVGVLKQVGRAADKIGRMQGEPPPVRLAAYQDEEGKPRGWVRHLAAKRASVMASASAAPVEAKPQVAVPTGSACGTRDKPEPSGERNPALPAGWGLDGFIVDPATWTRDGAVALAGLMSLELTAEHWKVLEWAREEFASAGTSPNIRRISQGAEVAVKDLYRLFPGKPGVIIAMIAGIPKPGGCL